MIRCLIVLAVLIAACGRPSDDKIRELLKGQDQYIEYAIRCTGQPEYKWQGYLEITEEAWYLYDPQGNKVKAIGVGLCESQIIKYIPKEQTND